MRKECRTIASISGWPCRGSLEHGGHGTDEEGLERRCEPSIVAGYDVLRQSSGLGQVRVALREQSEPLLLVGRVGDPGTPFEECGEQLWDRGFRKGVKVDERLGPPSLAVSTLIAGVLDRGAIGG